MIEQNVTIGLVQGLAARPAAEFVKRASSFTCSVKIGKGGQFIDAKSILGVMSMAFSCGEEIVIQVDGSDEEQAVKSLTSLLASENFS